MGGMVSLWNGNKYEGAVYDFLIRHGFDISDIHITNDGNIHKHDDYDLDIPHLNLRIEVKGTENGHGYFKFWKHGYSKRANCYAFVFHKDHLVLFFTKQELLDILGRSWLWNAGRCDGKHIPIGDIYAKAIPFVEGNTDEM